MKNPIEQRLINVSIFTDCCYIVDRCAKVTFAGVLCIQIVHGWVDCISNISGNLVTIIIKSLPILRITTSILCCYACNARGLKVQNLFHIWRKSMCAIVVCSSTYSIEVLVQVRHLRMQWTKKRQRGISFLNLKRKITIFKIFRKKKTKKFRFSFKF